MLFVVVFEDDASHAESRRRLMALHLAFLQHNASAIKAAGPLTSDDSDGFAGGLWLVEAGCREEVCRLYENDPLWPTGLRKSVQVYEWKRVFADGKNLFDRITP